MESKTVNNSRRKTLKNAENYLVMAREIIYDAQCEEEECLSNMPENLECSERHDKMEDAIDNLIDASSSIGDAMDSLFSAMS